MKLSVTTMKWIAVLSLGAVLLTACSGNNDATEKTANPQQPAQPSPNNQASAPANNDGAKSAPTAAAKNAADAYKSIIDEFGKTAKGEKPDLQAIAKTYHDSIKELAQARDGERNETTEQQISAAIEAASTGQLDVETAKQVVDKLMQKVLYHSVNAKLKDAGDNLAQPDKAKKAMSEAKALYKPVLETTVSKRDAAFKTSMADVINGAFAEADKAVDSKSSLDFNLAKQVIDKTMMKAFYLAVGAKDAGYAYKIEKAVKEGKKPKAEQAEGWAFYQSLYKYISGSAKEEADFINKQFDLTNDAKNINADAVNAALVRGLGKVALGEYKESEENWGKEKAVITSIEGALFSEMISQDIARLAGDAASKALKAQTEKHLAATKAGNKDEADKALQQIEKTLKEIVDKAK